MSNQQQATHAAIPLESFQKLLTVVQELPYKTAQPLITLLGEAKGITLQQEEATDEQPTDE